MNRFGLYPAVVLFFCFAVFTQMMVTSGADYDTTEQFLQTQFFKLGYGAQPPLYTWLAMVMGGAWFSLSLFKVFLLSAIVLISIEIVCADGWDNKKVWLVLCGFLFIGQFSWDALRVFTHTNLLALSVLLVVYSIKQILRTDETRYFILLGVSVAVGLLSKYNFVFVLIAFFISAWIFHPVRTKVIFDKRFILSFFIALLLVLPHGVWLMSNMEVYSQVQSKHHSADSMFETIKIFFTSFIVFLLPLLLFVPLLKKKEYTLNAFEKFLELGLLIIFLEMLIYSLINQVGLIKERWFLGMMILIPVVLAGRFTFSGYYKERVFKSAGILIGVVILIALPGRFLYMKNEGVEHKRLAPYKVFASKMQSNLDYQGTVYYDDPYMAGNLKQYSKEITFLPLSKVEKENALLICKIKCVENMNKWTVNASGRIYTIYWKKI